MAGGPGGLSLGGKIDDVSVTCRGETHPDIISMLLSAHVSEGNLSPHRYNKYIQTSACKHTQMCV